MTGKILQTIYARFIRKESVPKVVDADMTMPKLPVNTPLFVVENYFPNSFDSQVQTIGLKKPEIDVNFILLRLHLVLFGDSTFYFVLIASVPPFFDQNPKTTLMLSILMVIIFVGDSNSS
ncbi:hypothetical protein QN277_015449 [Acacia crassicarpa]|uniref:Uncharacterized protein n=1 Tax=Acacia crassicarpa TaxID=499986 RepID=A0AAE1MVK0_9FABA|nr:hypothetical protein QN277_015449 [Acacia crassicarpa]